MIIVQEIGVIDNLKFISSEGIFKRLLYLPKTEKSVLKHERPEEMFINSGDEKTGSFKDFEIDEEVNIDEVNSELGTTYSDVEELKTALVGYLIF